MSDLHENIDGKHLVLNYIQGSGFMTWGWFHTFDPKEGFVFVRVGESDRDCIKDGLIQDDHTGRVMVPYEHFRDAFWHCMRHVPVFRRTNPHDPDLDASMADIVVQHAVFGETVFA